MNKTLSIAIIIICCSFSLFGQRSIARIWNEALLEAIRNDYARPTVHARNLFHLSVAMYDAWAVYSPNAECYLLGKKHLNKTIPFDDILQPADVAEARREAISYACYRLMDHRFKSSPDWHKTSQLIDHLMDSLGYDRFYFDLNYTDGNPAALGNYIAEKIIDFGYEDGANEWGNYENLHYQPANTPLQLDSAGSQGLLDPNRWQPLAFEEFVDQSGNPIGAFTPDFLSPEWGNVYPFSLTDNQLTTHSKDGNTYKIYHDPGQPVYLQMDGEGTSAAYKWGAQLVSIWASHLSSKDEVLWDISPGAIGNLDIEDLPTNISELNDFYALYEGGDTSTGYAINPATNAPYDPQLVPRGDYARVLAEFWADGPDSETPPGHWFVILNYINDHPQLVKKFKGQGGVLDDLEWDVKAYFALGGAMHDAAIAAWSVKGYYDYIRPISAIRYLSDLGQSSDESLPNYHPAGIQLIDGYIEIVKPDDPLAGMDQKHSGKVKLFTWKGHDFIQDPDIDAAGVGWVLAENWMPYQRPTFVTPPFAGYVSGHSTYSRAAARILSLFTGDEYFPGGMGAFTAKKDAFLVFEQGPGTDVILQWAKYFDASDQCSLSRIWGGIHVPIDDIPGRLIGDKIGRSAFTKATSYFNGEVVSSYASTGEDVALRIYPNPVKAGAGIQLDIDLPSGKDIVLELSSVDGRILHRWIEKAEESSMHLVLPEIAPGLYLLNVKMRWGSHSQKIKVE